MISFLLQVGLALAIAFLGGVASLRYVLDTGSTVAATKVGAWYSQVVPLGGSPYSRARTARDPQLLLGPGEGIAFIADRDSEGRRFDPKCAYVVGGSVPPARFWTIRALTDLASASSALHSLELLRDERNDFSVIVSRWPAPGNWLRGPDGDGWRLVLTLYDTSIAAGTGVTDVTLPRIVRTECRD